MEKQDLTSSTISQDLLSQGQDQDITTSEKPIVCSRIQLKAQKETPTASQILAKYQPYYDNEQDFQNQTELISQDLNDRFCLKTDQLKQVTRNSDSVLRPPSFQDNSPLLWTNPQQVFQSIQQLPPACQLQMPIQLDMNQLELLALRIVQHQQKFEIQKRSIQSENSSLLKEQYKSSKNKLQKSLSETRYQIQPKRTLIKENRLIEQLQQFMDTKDQKKKPCNKPVQKQRISPNYKLKTIEKLKPLQLSQRRNTAHTISNKHQKKQLSDSSETIQSSKQSPIQIQSQLQPNYDLKVEIGKKSIFQSVLSQSHDDVKFCLEMSTDKENLHPNEIENQALKNQCQAQQTLIENLTAQVSLIQEYAESLAKQNQELNQRIDQIEADCKLKVIAEVCECSRKENQLDKMRREYQMVFPADYHCQGSGILLDQVYESDGSIIRQFERKKEILFKTGVRREQYNDGYFVVYFENGDILQSFSKKQKTVYFFNKSEVTQTELANGDKILLFKNGQLEKHFINGTKQIYYNDGSQKFINY